MSGLLYEEKSAEIRVELNLVSISLHASTAELAKFTSTVDDNEVVLYMNGTAFILAGKDSTRLVRGKDGQEIVFYLKDTKSFTDELLKRGISFEGEVIR